MKTTYIPIFKFDRFRDHRMAFLKSSFVTSLLTVLLLLVAFVSNIAAQGGGYLYVAEHEGNRIAVYNEELVFQHFIPTGGPAHCADIATVNDSTATVEAKDEVRRNNARRILNAGHTPKEIIMKTKIMPLNAVTIAASIMFLIFTTNDTGSAQTPIAGLVAIAATTIRTEMDFVSSLTRPTAVPGVYDLSFRKYRNGVMEPVSSLPARGGPLVLFAHVEDTAGNPAQSGTASFEYCGDFEPKEACEAGLARWNRLNRVSIGACSCPSCGGLPNFDPGPGNACLFVFETGGFPAENGFRFKYAGSRSGIDGGTSGAANFTWTDPL